MNKQGVEGVFCLFMYFIFDSKGVFKMKKISITDITLKKLSEQREVALLFREKTAIASCVDLIGADSIELPPVKNIREDSIIYKTIAQNVKNATLAICVKNSTDEIISSYECIKDAKHKRIQIELPISTVQMEYTYHLKGDKMLLKIAEMIKCAKSLCDDVEFSALDATRADEDFIILCAKSAKENGAKIFTICDDAGVSLPNEIALLVKKIKDETGIDVFVQPSDRISMGVASSIEAVKYGADGIKCAMAGKDVLLMDKISDALNTCSSKLGIETNLDYTKIHASIDKTLENVNHQSYENESEVGGIKKVLLDNDSTLSQVAKAASDLGYDLSESDVGNVHKALMQVCEKKSEVGAKEFEALIASSAMQAPSFYHLENYTTNSTNLSSSMSQVTLKYNDEIISGVSIGDGPIDSAFRAIEQCIGYHYELDDFQVHSVTEGKEALGSAVVRLRNNGKLYSGNGISTDIVAASIRAYINAINKIVFEEA